MPTYEYACTSCGNHIEAVQGFADQPLETCEICGGRLRRVFHPVGVMFKGSGFYSTDSRSKKTRTTDSPKADKTDGTKTSSDTSGDTKPSDAKSKTETAAGKTSSEKAS